MSANKNNLRPPAAFNIEDELSPNDVSGSQSTVSRKPRYFDEPDIRITPEDEDPFLRDAEALGPDGLDSPITSVNKRSFSFTKLAFSALGVVLSLAIGLWVDGLVRSLFAREPWLGYLALSAVCIGLCAGLVVATREVLAIMRLSTVQLIKRNIAEAHANTDAHAARKALAALTALLTNKAETALGRQRLSEMDDDIVDAPQLVEFCEREMMGPLDLKARGLILNASKRVSVVTAISPRAAVDLIYVLYESVRLVRNMSELYGGRPGSLGLFRLMRNVLAHLAITGSIAVGDSLVQQMLGHGLASKVSARFGEGMINGLMTARIGISAMDLCRPMPFNALKRPSIADFISDLGPGTQRDLSNS